MLLIFHGHPISCLLINNVNENYHLFFKHQILCILKLGLLFLHLNQHIKTWFIHADFVEQPIRMFVKQFHHVLMACFHYICIGIRSIRLRYWCPSSSAIKPNVISTKYSNVSSHSYGDCDANILHLMSCGTKYTSTICKKGKPH